MRTIIGVYKRKFEERGFITFTSIDTNVERFLAMLREEGIKIEVRHFEGFITISKLGNANKKKRTVKTK